MDDVLCCLHNPHMITNTMELNTNFKDGSVVPPKIYLGPEIRRNLVRSEKSHWSILSTQYVKNATKAVKVLLKYEDRHWRKVNSDVKQPLLNRYQPELEQSDKMIPELALRYLLSIGILR